VAGAQSGSKGNKGGQERKRGREPMAFLEGHSLAAIAVIDRAAGAVAGTFCFVTALAASARCAMRHRMLRPPQPP
jgi:hypothetical protein